MRKILLTIVAAIVLALGTTLGTAVMPTAAPDNAPQLVQDVVEDVADVAAPEAAHAGWPGGSVDYWRYYGGRVPYIMLDCDGIGWRDLNPGQWSKGGTCADVNGFVVFSGSKLFCGERYGLRDYVYYPGYHSIGNFAYRACEMRAHSG